MKRWSILLLSLILISCHDDIELPPATMKQVVVVYMIAENSLSSPFATNDLNEIRRATNDIPDSCKLIVYIDEARSDIQPRILCFDKTGEQVVYQYSNDPISTDSASMQQALSIITSKYPAKRYGLVMWSHGSGWLPEKPRSTIGIDNGRNSSSNVGKEMEISTLANIMRNTRQQWDYVFFDACFMQCVEVAYELRDVVDWCIGSPAEIPGNGAPYHKIMGDLFRDSSEVWRIAETYYDYYNTSNGVVISAIKTDEMEHFANVSAPLLTLQLQYPDTDGVQIYLRAPSWYPNYHDMGSAMRHWLSDEDYALWLEAAKRLVPHRFASDKWDSMYSGYFSPVITDGENILCMSLYIPSEGQQLNNYYTRTSWWKMTNGL